MNRPSCSIHNRCGSITTFGLAFVVLLGAFAACGGDSSPADVTGPSEEPPLEVASGLFDVTAKIIFDTCNSTTNHNGSYTININGQTFRMGDAWSGVWNATTSNGIAESEHERTDLRNCTTTTWTEVNITFSSEDEFSGEIIYRRRVVGSCGSRTPCTTTWRINGVRQ